MLIFGQSTELRPVKTITETDDSFVVIGQNDKPIDTFPKTGNGDEAWLCANTFAAYRVLVALERHTPEPAFQDMHSGNKVALNKAIKIAQRFGWAVQG